MMCDFCLSQIEFQTAGKSERRQKARLILADLALSIFFHIQRTLSRFARRADGEYQTVRPSYMPQGVTGSSPTGAPTPSGKDATDAAKDLRAPEADGAESAHSVNSTCRALSIAPVAAQMPAA